MQENWCLRNCPPGESLHDIGACLRAQRSKLYHLGIRSTVAPNTFANANPVRDGLLRTLAETTPRGGRERPDNLSQRSGVHHLHLMMIKPTRCDNYPGTEGTFRVSEWKNAKGEFRARIGKNNLHQILRRLHAIPMARFSRKHTLSV